MTSKSFNQNRTFTEGNEGNKESKPGGDRKNHEWTRMNTNGMATKAGKDTGRSTANKRVMDANPENARINANTGRQENLRQENGLSLLILAQIFFAALDHFEAKRVEWFH